MKKFALVFAFTPELFPIALAQDATPPARDGDRHLRVGH